MRWGWGGGGGVEDPPCIKIGYGERTGAESRARVFNPSRELPGVFWHCDTRF